MLVREVEDTHVGELEGQGCRWLKLMPNDIKLGAEGISGATPNVHDTATHVLLNEEDHGCGEGWGDGRLPSLREHLPKNLRCKL